MPIGPLRFCRAPGCSARVRRGYCPVHAEARRQAFHYKYSEVTLYGGAWKRARLAFLGKHPRCKCGRLANEVDHVIPHRGSLELFWDSANWQALCRPCHTRKTAREVFDVNLP